jgi:hypothetical protein
MRWDGLGGHLLARVAFAIGITAAVGMSAFVAIEYLNRFYG